MNNRVGGLFRLRLRLLGLAWRTSLKWPVAILIIVALMVPTLSGVNGTVGVALRDWLDLFSVMMSSPIALIFPLLVVFIASSRLYQEMGNRYIVAVRVRVSIRRYLGSKLLVASLLAFVTFGLSTFLAFVVAFYVWPAIGNPSVQPELYDMTPAQAATDSLTRVTFSSLLGHGPWTYGAFYSVWVGFSAALYAAFGTACLVLVSSRVFALAIPFLGYFVQTVGAALLGTPQYGLLYAAFPFGLIQSSAWVAIVPTAILAAVVAALWVHVFVYVRRLETLQ